MQVNLESKRVLVGYLLIAYLFSFLIRMIWVYQFQGAPQFMWNDQLMINTNDGYFFAAGAQEALSGLHQDNPRIPDFWAYGTVFFTTLFTKITPFSLETITLYMPAVISSLVVIPMILIARLYGKTLWGVFAALLGSITWSYYNRTMIGYYDTDMFSAMAPMIVLFFLIKSTLDFNLRSTLYGGIAIISYPFLYDQGQAIVYAMGIIYGIYMVWYHRVEKVTYASLTLIFISLIPLSILGIDKPFNYLVQCALIVGIYLFLKKETLEKKKLMIFAGLSFLLFMLMGNVFSLIIGKVISYTVTGTEGTGLHFYAVNQTVREAGKIPFEIFAKRTSGSIVGVIIALMGYIVLVLKHRAFILALPLIGIGIFSLWGGLRFTVYAVPVAAMSAVYLFWIIAETFIAERKWRYSVIALCTAGLIYPNITHIIGYKVPTVFNNAEVTDLVKLDKIADAKDYTLSWWDYGYPIWYYSDTSTLIDGGKHNNDNFIISKIMQTTSPTLAANLSRLAVETYVDSNYSTVADTLFQNKKIDSNLFLLELGEKEYSLPTKTRDIYLYLPYRMLGIFPTVAVFGNLDLNTGKRLRKINFYNTRLKKRYKEVLEFSNGIGFNTQNGILSLGAIKKKVKQFIVTQNTKSKEILLNTKNYYPSGEYIIIYMKSYGKFLLMDEETFHSTYIQMFVLGKYDKKLFDLVVSSPYSKIYKLKK
jgi:dolichyl-diphosphooligosaccharide--protein glycosyltransferase/undecaprenyl-diphosphooligosaccharide--protein glycosyltransferase